MMAHAPFTPMEDDLIRKAAKGGFSASFALEGLPGRNSRGSISRRAVQLGTPFASSWQHHNAATKAGIARGRA